MDGGHDEEREENGDGILESDPRGQRVVDDTFLLIFNAHHEPIEFTLPGDDYAAGWTVVVDTAELEEVEPVSVKAGETLTVAARATVVLQAQA